MEGAVQSQCYLPILSTDDEKWSYARCVCFGTLSGLNPEVDLS